MQSEQNALAELESVRITVHPELVLEIADEAADRVASAALDPAGAVEVAATIMAKAAPWMPRRGPDFEKAVKTAYALLVSIRDELVDARGPAS
jgi:hypothetical protein